MKNILLVTMTKPTLRGVFPDNGLALLASMLQQNGYTPRILDLCTTDSIQYMNNWTNYACSSIKEEIEQFHPDAIGWKTWMNQAREQFDVQKNISQEYPDILMINGGPHVGLFDNYMKGFLRDKQGSNEGFIDVLFRHGGEDLVGLLGLEKKEWEKIPSITFKRDGIIIRNKRYPKITNLDSLPFGSYDSEIYPAMKGDPKLKMIYRNANRGCSHAQAKGACGFCSHPSISGRYIEQGLESIIRETEYLLNQGFFLQRFGNSTTPPELANGFAKKCIERGFNKKLIIAWQGNIRYGKKYNFDLIKKGGTQAIFYGAESGNQKELNLWGKSTTPQEIEEVVKKTQDTGIAAILSFVYTGNEKATEETIKLIKRAKPAGITMFPLLPLPHTDVSRNPEEYGVEIEEGYYDGLFSSRLNLTQKAEECDCLVYKVNNKTHKQLLKETGKITSQLEQEERIPTRVSDESYLLAEVLGEPILEVREAEELFNPENAEEAKKFVSKVNKAISKIPSKNIYS